MNQSYWSPKLARNVERDARDTALLQNAGLIVIRIWEHESSEVALEEVRQALAAAPR